MPVGDDAAYGVPALANLGKSAMLLLSTKVGQSARLTSTHDVTVDLIQPNEVDGFVSLHEGAGRSPCSLHLANQVRDAGREVEGAYLRLLPASPTASESGRSEGAPSVTNIVDVRASAASWP